MTGIEWVKGPDNTTQGITANSKTGCRNHTPEGLCLGGLFPCYAFKLANGILKERYSANRNMSPILSSVERLPFGTFSDPFYPRWWPERPEKIRGLKKPTGIFLDDMSDWMGDWPEEWTRQEIQVMKDCPQHRFYTLTKQPQNLIKFSPFPENVYIGVTATNSTMFADAMNALVHVEARIKFISFEPLLEWHIEPDVLYGDFKAQQLDWLIIGACTGTQAEMTSLARNNRPFLTEMPYGNRWTAQPNPEWVREIVEAADKIEHRVRYAIPAAGVKVFLKNNLRPLLIPDDCSKPNYLHEDIFWASEKAQLRQEMPE